MKYVRSDSFGVKHSMPTRPRDWRRRGGYLDEQRSFVTETLFSHESKLDLIRNAQAQGVLVLIFHVNVQSADIPVARVRSRVTQGGHDVPMHKIRERYERNKRHIRDAVALADIAQILDSWKLNTPARHICTFKEAELDKAVGDISQWAKDIYGA